MGLEVVRFLLHCADEGIELVQRPPYERGWMFRERTEAGQRETHNRAGASPYATANPVGAEGARRGGLHWTTEVGFQPSDCNSATRRAEPRIERDPCDS